MEKWGLVLSGGGGKGAFQVGTWKALAETGMIEKISAISGASVGIINAVMFAQNDLEKTQKIWKNINPLMFLEPMLEESQQLADVIIFDENNLIKAVTDKYEYVVQTKKYEMYSENKYGVFTRDGFLKLIRENVDLDKVSKSDKEIYVNMCRCAPYGLELDYYKVNGKEPEEIKSMLLAASALPYVYDAVQINGEYYRDGGLMDNVPIKPLYEAGYRNIIVVALKPEYEINKEEFPDCNFILIKPSHSLGGFMDGTLDFTSDGAKFRMALGYRNSIRVLNAYLSGEYGTEGYKQLLSIMAELDYDAAKQDVRQEQLFDTVGSHMDKLNDIYNKYM